MAYLLDSDVLINAKNHHYRFDFCPAFWDWLDVAHEDGVVRSVDRVYREILDGDDDLVEWVKPRQAMFTATTGDELASIAAVVRWANDSPDYTDEAKIDFQDSADAYLLGHALAHGDTVVTHEKISDGRRRIKIPNAAIANRIEVTDPFEMLRNEGVRFVLGGRQ